MRTILRAAALVAALWTGVAQAEPVLLISIDGLRRGDILEAEARGIAVPNLRRFLTEGSYADGVTGVFPTFTLPSHATLITGVSPAKHGIIGNLFFWPKDQVVAQSYLFADDIKVPTLWDVAHAKGIGTASINWPTSLGAASIDHNLSTWFTPPTGQPNDAKYVRLLSSPGLVDRLEREIGPINLAQRHNAADEGEDERIASRIISDFRPGFTTLHFGALDEAEHKYGPGSPQAKAALEVLDGLVGKVIAAQRAALPDSVIAIVSDHGFTAVKTEINLQRAFLEAGLITADASGKVGTWEAIPWPAGGSAAIILARPDDKQLRDKVWALLTKLKADPALGIEEIFGADEIARRGGFPNATFGLSYRLDTTGAVRPLSQALVAPAIQAGTHGHAASHPELRATFLIAGPGIPRGRDVGVIDMRAIAPTLAKILGVSLPQADVAAIDFTKAAR